MTSKGTNLTNEIRAAISTATNGRVKTFRCNAGSFWQGEVVAMQDGLLVLRNPRQIEGLPEGFPDLLAIIPEIVTPDMVGKTVALAGFVEVKTENDRVSRRQEEFLAMARMAGCRAGIARSPEDAVKIVTGGI
jgi:hypothetical protein